MRFAADPKDVFQAGNIAAPNGGQTVQVGVMGHCGRSYTLLRTTSDPSTNSNWTPVTTTGLLSADTSLMLSDPNPPKVLRAFYRIDVTMP